MKKWTFITIITLLILCPVGRGAEPNAPGWTVWPAVGGTVAEVRGGYDWDRIEFYAAPRYDKAFARGGDFATGLRSYAIYDFIDAELAARLLHAQHPLPDGTLYGGLFLGYEFSDINAWESGWCVGGGVEIAKLDAQRTVLLTTEYQWRWDKPDGDLSGPGMLVTGLKIPLKWK